MVRTILRLVQLEKLILCIDGYACNDWTLLFVLVALQSESLSLFSVHECTRKAHQIDLALLTCNLTIVF